MRKLYNKIADFLLKYKIVDIRSDYSSSILKVFSGGSVAFIIGFIAMPIISRIYPPEEFGRFQLMMSVVISFAVVSAFRYEMAIVLEETKEDRDKLVTLCLILLLITTGIFTIIFFSFGETVLGILNAKELLPYIGFMSLMFVGFGLYEISRYTFISDKKFKDLAINNVVYQSTMAGLQTGGGLILPKFITLFSGLIVAYFVAFFLAFYKIRFKIKINFAEAKFLLKKHKKFFLFDTPANMVDYFTSKLPILFLTKYHGAEYTGYFAMAVLILDAPLGIIMQSISQVYIRSAKDACVSGKNELMNLYKNTVKKLAIFAILPLITILIFADVIVNIFLGEDWSEVAWILRILSFTKVFQFINSPVSTTFQVLNKNEIPLFLILFYLIFQSLIIIYLVF